MLVDQSVILKAENNCVIYNGSVTVRQGYHMTPSVCFDLFFVQFEVPGTVTVHRCTAGTGPETCPYFVYAIIQADLQ